MFDNSVFIKFGAIQTLPWDGELAPQLWLIWDWKRHAEITHPDCTYSFSCMTKGWSDWRFDKVWEDAEIGTAVISAVDPHGINRHYWSVRFGHDGDPRIEQWGGTFTLHHRFYDSCIEPEREEKINEILDAAWMAEGIDVWKELMEANGEDFDTAPREWLLLEIENRATIYSMELFKRMGFKNYGNVRKPSEGLPFDTMKNAKIAEEIKNQIETDLKEEVKKKKQK